MSAASPGLGSTLRIAIASGKGGTGKTTIATNLAVVLAETGSRVAYVDCDVEEPNGHLFLRPELQRTREVAIPVPEVDPARCTLCGLCGQACRYSAIVALPQKILTFPKLCHGCGACVYACLEEAIREVPRVTGVVEVGVARDLAFLQGRLSIGEAMAPPVIRAVLDAVPAGHTVILDAPPGTSCPVIAAVKAADVVLLVTEPTPFGLNDLALAVALVRELEIPFGVLTNRAGSGDDEVARYCAREGIPVLLELPDDLAIAQAYSRGELAVDAVPSLRPLFGDLFEQLVLLTGGAPPAPFQAPAPVVSAGATGLTPPSEALQILAGNDLKELVVVSGKGGTGKTSVVASFFALTEGALVADCDVDAADLHLVLAPEHRGRWPFIGGVTAVIDQDLCTACGECESHCRFDAIQVRGASGERRRVDPVACEGCGLCVDCCPEGAARLEPAVNGEWYLSETRHGPMAHARLGIAQENSGKLVSILRREAKALGLGRQLGLLIVDGSPGIGCPVIASITGADLVLLVTEPTLSGLHDLRRVAELCRQLRARAGVCINKVDLNLEVARRIEEAAAQWGLPVLGRIRYDPLVTRAQVQRQAVVEGEDGPAAQDLRALWDQVKQALA